MLPLGYGFGDEHVNQIIDTTVLMLRSIAGDNLSAQKKRLYPKTIPF